MVSRVPDDIWRQITQFITEDELKGLLGINVPLFHLAMDARYRDVVLARFDHAMHRKLRRLRDPAVAPRVRRLSVDMSNYPQKSHTTSPEAARSPARREPRPVENHVTNFEGSCEGIIKDMIDTVCGFYGVVEFSISWRDPARAPNEEECSPFLAAAWNTFGSQLRKFNLDASLRQLQTLLCTSGRLDAVEELQFEIGCLLATHEDVLATSVAPFINRAALNLKSLTILFDGNPPYPPLFNSLGETPKLESLTLHIPSNSYGFSEEQGLTRILRNHAATLRHVRWKTHHWSDWTDVRNYNPIIKWMKQNQSDETILSNLHTLEIMVPAGPVAFGFTMGYIRRSADTLTSLVLSGAYLTGAQAKTMMSIFTHRRSGPHFQELNVQVEFLSPDMVSTIAQIFPCLGILVLWIVNASGSGQDLREPESEDEELAFARGFAEEMRRLDLRGWQLHDIGISTSCYTELGLDNNLMRLFAECVPSIKCFWGQDKETVHWETDVGQL